MRFHAAQIGGFQNSPICVWSAVRVDPVAAPRRNWFQVRAPPALTAGL
jgi:hypothetical protein